MPNLTSDITIKIEIINKQFDRNIKNITFSIFNETGISKDTDVEFFFITNGSPVNYDIVSCLTEKATCLIEKASINSGYTTCAITRDECLEEYEGKNATNTQNQLDACSLRIQQKDVELQGQVTTIGNLEEEKESTGNEKWVYAVIAAILGVVGCLLYTGKIGKGSVKDKSMDEFNKSQQG